MINHTHRHPELERKMPPGLTGASRSNGGGSRTPQDLRGLFDEIQQARRSLRDVRHLGSSAAVTRQKERQLHDALDAYVAALTALRLPVPCVIRDELRIYHDVLAGYGD